MEEIVIGKDVCQAEMMTFGGINIMLIKGARGALGCAYLNLAAAEKFDHALAIVSGVKTYEDMLNTEVKAVSPAATAAGVKPGMSGREALEIMQ